MYLHCNIRYSKTCNLFLKSKNNPFDVLSRSSAQKGNISPLNAGGDYNIDKRCDQ